MSKLSGTVERKAKLDRVEQLEKHIANGKQLVGRLCQEVEGKNQIIEQQVAQLRASQSIIGVLVAMAGEKEIEVSRAAIREMIEKYNVSSTESEDKLSFIIKVEEAKDNVEHNAEEDSRDNNVLRDEEGARGNDLRGSEASREENTVCSTGESEGQG